jgi:peptidyl-prolyl cis-trans isomerase B (cyclophilin B)
VASSKDRERELARQRYQRQLERRAASQAKARQRLMIGLTAGSVVVIIVAVVLLSVLGGSKKSGSGTSAAAASTVPSADASANPSAAASGSATASTAATVPVGAATLSGGTPLKCTTPPAKPAKPLSFKAEPAMTIDTKATYTATITTNCGVIKATLDTAKAPHTVNSFAFLAGKGYFTNTPCHRLVTSGIYVLQCGDPTGTGSGGPGYTIPDENLTGATYGPGVLAMANTGQTHTGGSQFFINYQTSQLPASYTPFGTITQGLDIVQAIAAEGAKAPDATQNTAPNQPVSILSFTVTKS